VDYLLHEVEGVNPRGRHKSTWKEVVEADVRNLKIKREIEDA